MAIKPKGLLISIEGVTGAGKTTLIKKLEAVHGLRIKVLGGYSRPRPESTPFHRDLLRALRRQLTVDPFLRLGWRAELLTVLAELHLADESLVRSGLVSGAAIVYEHHLDSIVAYESARVFEDGVHRSLSAAVRAIGAVVRVCSGVKRPDATLFIDVDPAEAVRRAALRDRRTNSAREIRFNEYVAAAYGSILSDRPRKSLFTISATELALTSGFARIKREFLKFVRQRTRWIRGIGGAILLGIGVAIYIIGAA